MDVEEEVFEEEPKPEKKIRRRTNNLYKMIRQQMEFYFSDSNLLRDRYLQQVIQDSADGYIDVELFMKFNKIRALTKSARDVANAMSKSKIVELSEDKTKLRRILPVKERANVDDCTIYVERLPEGVNHDWLKTVFSKFGAVLYVGLPHFRHSGKLKGFAFIEFDTSEAAYKACQYYGAESEENELSQQPTDEPANHSLEENALPPPAPPQEKKSKRKRKREKEEEEEQAKRQKLEVIEELPNNSDKEPEKKDENSENSGKVKKKKHRKRDKHKKKAKTESEVEDVALRVMSKREWKSWKNRYLSLQKKAMTQVKHALSLNNHPTENAITHPIKEMENKPKCKTMIEFQPGVIIRIEMLNPISELAKFKIFKDEFQIGSLLENPCLSTTLAVKCDTTACDFIKSEKVRQMGDVAYVDLTKEVNIAYVRCSNEESAKKILENDSKEAIGNFVLLTGTEEKLYWDKIKNSKETKYASNKRKQKRGRDKITAKVDKLIQNKHIHFDD